MAVLHRALFTWFILLVFLILLCLRLESRTHWNWFIVFIPMWLYDGILLIYVIFHMITHCKNGVERFRGIINKNVWYITAIGLKMAAQIIVCIKLEYTKVNLPIYVVMAPIWILLPVLTMEVFMHLSQRKNCNKSVPVEVTHVPAGKTAILKCNSNDKTHNFMFWQLNQDQIIGPGNFYDETKYKYEVLSGKLFIKEVSPHESGVYKCVSQSIENAAHNVGKVDLLVTGGEEANTVMDAVKLVCIMVSIIVIIGCAVIYYKLRKDWKKYDGRVIAPAEDMDDEDEGEEIYARTTTTAPMPAPRRNVSTDQLLGFDNPTLERDFNNVFEVKMKAPPRSLI